MPAHLSPDQLSTLIAQLRDAGCVFAEDEAQLIVSAARTAANAAAMAGQRAAGLPLEHVVGWAEFCGLRVAMDPHVVVPRRRSEFLVHQAAALAALAGDAPSPVVVVDLCCGSGAIGAGVAASLGAVELHACDIDPAAVRCARRNVAAFGGRVYLGDLYHPLPAALRGRVAFLLANAPYVPTDGLGLLPAEARLHEPPAALDGGPDGLAVLRRVAAGARAWLAPRGYLLVETSEGQAPRMAAAMAGAGLAPRTAHSSELAATVVIGTR